MVKREVTYKIENIDIITYVLLNYNDFNIPFPSHISRGIRIGTVQKLRNDQRGEGVNDFVTYRYVHFEGEGDILWNSCVTVDTTFESSKCPIFSIFSALRKSSKIKEPSGAAEPL